VIKQLYILAHSQARARAKEAIDKAPDGFRVEIREQKRSLEQNDRLHAMIDEVAAQTDWHGQKLNKDDWKLLFLNALDSEMRIIPNWNGDGVLPLGRKTSRLSVNQCRDLITIVEVFGAQRGVKFHDAKDNAA